MIDGVYARLRECWVRADNRRLSCTRQGWTDLPTLHAVVVESIRVEEAQRRQGLCKAYLNALCADPRFELVIVEAVQNPILAEALLRWGWDCDPGVMDFYFRKESMDAH